MNTLKKQAKRVLNLLGTKPAMPFEIHNKVLRVLLLLCGWGVLALLPVYCLGMTEYIHFSNKARTLQFFLTRTPVVLFDLLILYLLWLCVLCLVKKGWAAVLLYGGLFSALSFVSYMKYAMTGDYFYPWDIQQTGNLGELTHFITVPFPVLYLLMIVFVFLLVIPVFLSGAELPARWYVRYPVLILTVVLMVCSVSDPNKVTKVLNKNGLYLEDMGLQSSNYYANGFVGAFTVNLLSINIQKPEGYDREAVQALMDGYHDVEADASFSSPDIILILSESFWDPTMLPGTTFSEDPLAHYREICRRGNAVSGRFFSTAFGGGTVRPEFEVITGLTTDYLPSGCVPWQYVEEEMPSYVSLYRDLGYTTMAVHPYTSSFYYRKYGYPLTGIDALHFEDDIYALADTIGISWNGGQISDDTFCSAIEYYLEEAKGTPVFLFGISMENHQPYQGKFETLTVQVENSAFDETTAEAVRNFTTGVKDADACLGRLVDYIDSRERDTVLVWYGDHLPTLGPDFGAYKQSGMIGAYDEADYERLYSTPFLIYANFDLGESTMVKEGEGNSIASYNLMNAAAQLIGAPRSAYMCLLEDYANAIPYYNVRLHKTVTAEQNVFIKGHAMLTYDMLAGGRYQLEP